MGLDLPGNPGGDTGYLGLNPGRGLFSNPQNHLTMNHQYDTIWISVKDKE